MPTLEGEDGRDADHLPAICSSGNQTGAGALISRHIRESHL
jgi:hypothetical protein